MSTITLIGESILIAVDSRIVNSGTTCAATTAVVQVSTCLRVVESGPSASPQWSAAVVPICRPRPPVACRYHVERSRWQYFRRFFRLKLQYYYTVAIRHRHQIIIITKHFKARVPPSPLSAGGTWAPRGHNTPIIIKLLSVAPLDERIFRNSLLKRTCVLSIHI